MGMGPRRAQRLVQHPEVPTISFTGGTTTGRDLAVSCAKQFKRTSLELGGKNPFVVFADADLDRAATEAAPRGLQQHRTDLSVWIKDLGGILSPAQVPREVVGRHRGHAGWRSR